jgi:phosphoribosylglycinamide formyltransferase 1
MNWWARAHKRSASKTGFANPRPPRPEVRSLEVTWTSASPRDETSSSSFGASPRIAVLTSNSGGHVQALLDDAVVGPWIGLVVAERSEAYALDRARWHGVPAVALRAGKSYLDLFDLALVRVLAEHGIDYVVVAGFTRIVGPATVHAYKDRILKLHRSLLPDFPGSYPVAEALADGAKLTGVSVHLVTEDLEEGQLVSQQAFAIRADDTWISVERRIHELELRLLPTAVRDLVEGRLEVGQP